LEESRVILGEVSPGVVKREVGRVIGRKGGIERGARRTLTLREDWRDMLACCFNNGFFFSFNGFYFLKFTLLFIIKSSQIFKVTIRAKVVL